MATKHTCMKTDKGGPYIFRDINRESIWLPVSLRGPYTNGDWAQDTKEDCINELRKFFAITEVKSFDTWQEMLQWAMDEPYLVLKRDKRKFPVTVAESIPIIQVIEVGRYRDGGTIEYKDKDGKTYYMWSPTKQVYPTLDYRRDNTEELPVKLEIVQSF